MDNLLKSGIGNLGKNSSLILLSDITEIYLPLKNTVTTILAMEVNVVKPRVIFSLILIAVFAVLPRLFVTFPVLSPISEVVAKVSHVLFVLSSAWFGFQALDIIFRWLNKRVKATESSFDDVVVPIAKTAGIILIVISAIVFVGKRSESTLRGFWQGLELGGWPWHLPPRIL